MGQTEHTSSNPHPPLKKKKLHSASDVQQRSLHFASVCATHKQILDRSTKAIEGAQRKTLVSSRGSEKGGRREREEEYEERDETQGSQTHQHLGSNLSTLSPTSPHPVFPSHLYRCHGCVILSGSESLKDAQAVEADDRGHHQVAVRQIDQGPPQSIKDQHCSACMKAASLSCFLNIPSLHLFIYETAEHVLRKVSDWNTSCIDKAGWAMFLLAIEHAILATDGGHWKDTIWVWSPAPLEPRQMWTKRCSQFLGPGRWRYRQKTGLFNAITRTNLV